MILNIFSVFIMTGMFIYMFKYIRTRRMSFIPLSCAILEFFTTGALTPTKFPILTAALIILRIVIIFCCIGTIRQDMLIEKRRANRCNTCFTQILMDSTNVELAGNTVADGQCA